MGTNIFGGKPAESSESVHIVFNLLVDYLEDWLPSEVAQLSMTCTCAKHAFADTMMWMKNHRWQVYESLPYRGRPIHIRLQETYLNPSRFQILVGILNESQQGLAYNYDIVWRALQYIEPEFLLDIYDFPNRRYLRNTMQLMTDLAEAHHKNRFVSQVLVLAAHKYRRYRLDDPKLMHDEHCALYRSMNLLAKHILRKGPSSLMNIYITHYIRFYNSDKRMRRISVWHW